MKKNHKITITIIALIIFSLLTNSNLNVIQIYCLGILYNIFYIFLNTIFKSDEDKENEEFINQFLSKETVQIIDITLCLLSWLAPMINSILLITSNNNNKAN